MLTRQETVRKLLLVTALSTGGWCAAQTHPVNVPQEYRAVGLRYPDGTPHTTPPAHAVTGKTINVRDFGADISDSDKDDTKAIEAALGAAKEGDEIYFPNGIYNLLTATTLIKDTNILLRSGVNLRGESTAGVVLVSSFDVGLGPTPYTVIRGQDVEDVLISQLTITSTWNKAFPTNPRVQNPERGGPLYAIAIESSKGFNQRVTFDSVNVERFARMGFRIGKGSSDILIRNCIAKDATDTGGGGAGYGFVFQGPPHQSGDKNPYLGTNNDNFFNVLESSKAMGPNIRHGALIQFWAHNNVVRNSQFVNTVYDAIDLHGEDEYLNEIAYNTITGTSAGAGIGLGNSGATHDKTGPWNWVHHNTVSNSMRGITVEFGTRSNLIEENVIQGNDTYVEQFGIGLGSVSDIVIRRNRIINNQAPAFSAIKLFANRAVGEEPAGSAKSNRFEGNEIHGNRGLGTRAVLIEEDSGGNIFAKNVASDNSNNTLPQ